MPNGAEETLRWGDSRQPPFSTSTRKGWVQDRPLIRPGFAGPPSPPRGRLWGWEELFPSAKPPPPARPAGGRAVTGVGSWAAGQAEKERTPAGSPQTRKGGSREEEPLPPWCSFLRLSSKESRAPPPESAGPPGRCAPRLRKSPDHPKGTQPRPPQKRDTPKGIPTFYSTVSWMEPVAFSACTMI